MPTNSHNDRHLSWDACHNIRDLGGYATHDGGQTRWCAIVRADNLHHLTPQGQAALLALAGVPDGTVAEDYAQSYTYMRPLYEQGLASIEDPAKRERLAALLLSPPEAMLGMLSHVRTRYGGVEAYLLASGLGQEVME